MQPVARGALVATVTISASVWSVPALAREPLPAVEAEAALPVVTWAELPSQARKTYRLILAGGPFPYEKDGTVFGNRERLLPRKPRGHYREYTVPTPGSRDRGARRMVCAGEVPKEPEACFYTEDHYASFRRVAP
ncbi:uncharacterized protein VITFI_CDS1448 [Vitreoscilla filiformis]|uniref:Uncharacterized protein n=1 Tax=Vitreoscilla filiformis TaxID=63 RepID=A0A221KDZ6_VITFI|nr:uncharacterized protein VITFI_CDS1448 [Vitreoscilla filiformis]